MEFHVGQKIKLDETANGYDRAMDYQKNHGYLVIAEIVKCDIRCIRCQSKLNVLFENVCHESGELIPWCRVTEFGTPYGLPPAKPKQFKLK